MLVFALAVVLFGTALAGRRIITAAAPLLMRVPRAAIGLLVAALLLWVAAACSLVVLLLLPAVDRSLLPAPFAEVCRRCLEAVSVLRFDGGDPGALSVLLPAIGVLALLALGVPDALRRRRSTRALARSLTGRSRRTTLHGHRVLLIEDARPLAFSLPRRSGGIVVSTGLQKTLTEGELTAVLEHEHEHLRGHHHLILGLLGAISTPLRCIPLAAAIADAVPHYLEITADSRARRATGTPAIASALLKIGAPQVLSRRGPYPGSVLHAAGPDRIRSLVAPPAVNSAVLPTSALCLVLGAFLLVAGTVYGPYLYVILSGCTAPSL